MDVSNIIIIIILILVLIWLLNRWFFKSNIVYDKMLEAHNVVKNGSESTIFTSNNNIITNSEFPENNTSNFMLSVWFYIDNWGTSIGNEKNILFMSSHPNSETLTDLQNMSHGISHKVSASSPSNIPYKNLNICLDEYTNDLCLDIETYPDKVSDLSSNYTRYKVKNIPIQKWNCLILSIDTKTFDVYLDGKLRNSFILHGSYKNDGKKNMYLGNMGASNTGFEGFITRVRYEPSSINPQEAYNIYKAGINASLAKSIFNRYSMKVAFLEYNKERGAFTI